MMLGKAVLRIQRLESPGYTEKCADSRRPGGGEVCAMQRVRAKVVVNTLRLAVLVLVLSWGLMPSVNYPEQQLATRRWLLAQEVATRHWLSVLWGELPPMLR